MLENEVLATRSLCLNLAWILRGGIQYNDVMNLSLKEREMINDISKENLEITTKSGLPFF